ncbi:MAG: hypothetical protein U5L96_00455 [Owenweeksia sp.]|nr:hypothetical protein [Owenweeksia sp.]
MHNIGLDSTYEDLDNAGYFGLTGDSMDLGRFRTANLRNVGLRSRFIHDGRFSSLEEVVEHYNSVVKNKPLPRSYNDQTGKSHEIKPHQSRD